MWRTSKNLYHLFQAVIANIQYGFPGRNMTVIGVTGTDGKTTTASIIYHILKTAGYKAALLTTVSAIIDDESFDTGFHVTTPDPFSLQKYLLLARKKGVTHFILETTSHSLDQNRVWGIPFAFGVLTNITHEHLDYHNTYEKYAEAKFKLLRKANVAIVNCDDESYKLIANRKWQIANSKVITYGLKETADITPKKFVFKTNLIGEFNQYNCLAAIATARQLSIDDETIRKALLTVISPVGRMEIVYDKDFRVIIDFAHTPNAIEKMLIALSKEKKHRLIHVFGSASKRDVSKRPLMGNASARFADVIILTAEDPRGESVEHIMADIQEGIPQSFVFKDYESTGITTDTQVFYKIADRKKAIGFAIQIAEKGDIVVMTGKAHESSMNYGKGEEPWDEFGVTYSALKKIDPAFTPSAH